LAIQRVDDHAGNFIRSSDAIDRAEETRPLVLGQPFLV
jgi:hypothetical protein